MAQDETDGRGGLRLRGTLPTVRALVGLGFRDGRLFQQFAVHTIGPTLAYEEPTRYEWRPVPTIPDGESVVEE